MSTSKTDSFVENYPLIITKEVKRAIAGGEKQREVVGRQPLFVFPNGRIGAKINQLRVKRSWLRDRRIK